MALTSNKSIGIVALPVLTAVFPLFSSLQLRCQGTRWTFLTDWWHCAHTGNLWGWDGKNQIGKQDFFWRNSFSVCDKEFSCYQVMNWRLKKMETLVDELVNKNRIFWGERNFHTTGFVWISCSISPTSERWEMLFGYPWVMQKNLLLQGV